MAQKRRGLGRGLQALIPEAQKEKVPAASRPSDVFFPDSRKDESRDEDAASQAKHDSPEPEPASETRSTRDLAATLLAPSQRKRGSKSRSTRSTTGAQNKQTKPVSRETTPDSTTDAEVTEKKTAKKSSSAGSAKRSASAAPKRVTKKATKAVPAVVEEPSHEASTAEDVQEESASTSVPQPESTPVVPEVSRETEEEQPEAADHGNSDAQKERTEEDLTAASADAGTEAPDETDAEEKTADTGADELVPVPGARFAEIPVELIHPNPRQPRQVFDEEDIAELAASIAEVGLLQPIVVRQVPTAPGEELRYELIMGERRLRASKEAGLETIPAVVRDTDDVDLLRDALLENLHRVQLNPLEEAAAYQQLLEDFQCTHAELSERIARSRSQISNTLRLMKLPPLVQRRLAANVISAGHARALLGLPNAAEMERLAQRVVAEGLSVRATEELVALHEEPEPGPDQPRVLRARSTPLPALSTRLSDAFDTRVKVTRGAKKGRITIEFAGDEDLARLVDALAPGTSLDEE
ncbi:ParB/RepB/Spo0J family partition protein [Actinomyces sp. oral taxon 175]|uniref:ParB/RepB/Spo0J family partition protein n=1 Tax=Actinomyces sp. oral taxon 175 TaxID=712119 RepID=UPI00021D2481|nr:ParB/RepB/Spo0J family partition protein [Actinomyces sp. oral taxon 175]EGV12919.1 ParB-like protein [Actinomyces sp. oral taxon 175 str. F0384]